MKKDKKYTICISLTKKMHKRMYFNKKRNEHGRKSWQHRKLKIRTENNLSQ